jgi:hypothetical protein
MSFTVCLKPGKKGREPKMMSVAGSKEAIEIDALFRNCTSFLCIASPPNVHIHRVERIPLPHTGYDYITADAERRILRKCTITLEVDAEAFAMEVNSNSVYVRLQDWRKPKFNVWAMEVIVH